MWGVIHVHAHTHTRLIPQCMTEIVLPIEDISGTEVFVACHEFVHQTSLIDILIISVFVSRN